MDDLKLRQDNATCHRAVRAMASFRENDMELLDWSAKSPDLNSIEHLWDLFKCKVKRLTVTSKEKLQSRLRLEWNAISPEDCKKLVASLSKIISALIKVKCWVTK
ncbi:hypothetical protein Trydic_g21536 [Trypoxylus dichotomus]